MLDSSLDGAWRAAKRFAIWFVLVATGCSSTSVGAPCTSSRECEGLVCDVSVSECVECLRDADCFGADERCLARRCVPVVTCTTSRECPGQVCNTDRGICVDCVADMDCFGAEVCDTRDGLCVECRGDEDCGVGEVCRSDSTCGPGDRRDAGRTDGGVTLPDAGPGDLDADADTIRDADEGRSSSVDTDAAAQPDYLDVDSDNDGIPDAAEAGDADPATPPVDSDGDGIADFRDTDSDDDGLSDSDEVTVHGTNPRVADSDGDGADDLVEIVAGTDPLSSAHDPRTDGNLVIEVPYGQPASPASGPLHFATAVQFADVYFLFDYSGSMGDESTALAGALTTLANDLTCTDSGVACAGDAECGANQVCNPFSGTCTRNPAGAPCLADPLMTCRCVPSLYTGAGRYSDNVTLENRVSLQSLPTMTATTLGYDDLAAGGTERLFDAVRVLVDPAALSGASGCTGPAAGRIGCPAYRNTAARILVAFTDEPSNGDSSTLAQAVSAANLAGLTVIGVWSGTAGSSQRANLRDLVIDTESYRADGTTPLFYEGSGTGIVAPLTAAIHEVLENVPLRVTIEATDAPGDAGDALQFIRDLPTNTTAAGCTALPTENVDADPAGDAFPTVTPGIPVCFDVVAEPNVSVMPALTPRVYEAHLTVFGNGSPLDRRRVFFLIRPRTD